MIELTPLLYKGISEMPGFDIIQSTLREQLNEDDFLFVKKVYEVHYENNIAKDVLGYTRRDKFSRRKKQWKMKALKGLEKYKKDKTLSRGVYRHLVENYIMMKEYEESKGSSSFKKMFKEKDSDTAIQSFVDDIEAWSKSKTTRLIDYPFFSELSKSQQIASLEFDSCMMVGEWLIKNVSKLVPAEIKDGTILFNEKEYLESQSFVERAPSTALENPYWGIAKRSLSPINKKSIFNQEEKAPF